MHVHDFDWARTPIYAVHGSRTRFPSRHFFAAPDVSASHALNSRVVACKASIFEPHPTPADCYEADTFGKLTDVNPGYWYSTVKEGYCDGGEGCTWRVVSVDKIVTRTCHVKVFGEAVQASAPPACLDACGEQKTNTTSPCWVDCFYKAALGPDSSKPGGAVAGMSLDDLVAAWQKPFLPEAQGGCPPQAEMAPWFERVGSA